MNCAKNDEQDERKRGSCRSYSSGTVQRAQSRYCPYVTHESRHVITSFRTPEFLQRAPDPFVTVRGDLVWGENAISA